MRAGHGLAVALAFGLASCGDEVTEAVSVSGGTESSTTTAVTSVSTTDDGGGTTSAESTSTESTGQSIDCPSLDAEQCADEMACMVIEGMEWIHISGNDYCFDEKAFAGCIADADCDNQETYGCDGNDPWRFSSTCIPDGWAVCDAPEGDLQDCL